jgi:hypothetical protein
MCQANKDAGSGFPRVIFRFYGKDHDWRTHGRWPLEVELPSVTPNALSPLSPGIPVIKKPRYLLLLSP